MATKVRVRPDLLKKSAHYLTQYAQHLGVWSLQTIATTPEGDERKALAEGLLAVQSEIEKNIRELLTESGEEHDYIEKVILSLKTPESKAVANKLVVQKLRADIKPTNILRKLTDKVLVKVSKVRV